MDVLRGLEGAATKAWYQGYRRRIIPPDFAFNGRSKRPPRDPLNSLLSLSYTLLYGELQTALLAHGIDPHPPFLHEIRSGHAALASDLSEPYRVLIADSFVLDLVNKKQVTKDAFEQRADGAFWLEAGARRRVLEAYEGFMARPLGGRSAATPRRLIEAAVRSMLRVVLGESDELRLPLAPEDVDVAEGECEA